MPPPIQQQGGSKAALITWTVITSILFVVATVLAIFANVDRQKIQQEKDQLSTRFQAYVSETDLTGDLQQQIEAVKATDESYRDMKYVNVLLEQRNGLIRQISGAGTASEADAKAQVANAVERAKVATDTQLQADSLVKVIDTLSTDLVAKKKQLESTEAARTTLNKKLAGLEENLAAKIKKQEEDLIQARANVTSTESGVSAYRAEKDKQLEALQAQADTAAKLAQDDMNKLQAQAQELQTQIKRQESVINGLQIRLGGLRQPVDQVVTQADGKILRTAGDGIVYIDLGSGDQVTTGMSFEIFDRLEGIPKPGDPSTNTNLPKGKASIEIIKVTPGSSEARIIRQTPGTTVVENDLLVNLVYDKYTKYNFIVYGNFDLDRNNQATAQDADVLKRLITSWGGAVTDKLNVDTDFIVMGKVPVIPEYTAEELDRPEVRFELERKQQELNAYDETLAKAQALNIPILNQNRFLYFVGYYEQSGR